MPSPRWPGGLLALLSLAAPLWAAEPVKRPNFVFLYTDDQRYDALSVVQQEQGDKGRFPWFQTPNMDRIAREGVRFRNAFVVSALCSPSRAAFLTGRYNHLNGIANNHTPFPTDSVTHASLLRQAGYTTGYVGKFHMGPQSGQRPGFDWSASFVGQGRYVDCPVEINGQRTETTGWIDDVSGDFAIDFLKKNRARPFLLVVGFKSPHGPFDPPARLKDRFAGEQARRAPNADSPPPYPRPERPPAKATPTVPVNLGYFRCIAGVDDNVGRILGALDEMKLADNTVVIFTSDNGFYLGEHGLGDKRSAYDESLRIPLLLRYPPLGVQGKKLDQLVLNIDLAPTLLDLAGVPIPKEMQGRSWRPLLEGKAATWRESFFYEYFYENNFAIPTVTAVRTTDAKLIRYPGHPEWTELFDLKQDPYEMRNLYKDAARADLRQRLETEYDLQSQAVGFRIPPYADDPAKAPPPKAKNKKKT